MELRFLGSLEVVGDDGELRVIPGRNLGALLARLAMDVGRVVPAERLVDDIWGDKPPRSADNSLQGLVSKLRRTLSPSLAVVNRNAGYALEGDAATVDVVHFEELTRRADTALQADDAVTARALLRKALALWRGPAFADLAYAEFVQAEAARLAELRLCAIESRIQCDLALGDHAGLLAELEPLITEQPLRERWWAFRMLALYRSGRQAEALETYQDARSLLAEELGLDPGPELRRLESAILAHDSWLDAPTRGAGVGTARSPVTLGNLPAPLTPLVGRSRELTDLAMLVRRQRLVTIVGPGGVGKTRLGIETARLLAGSFTYGTWLVELAPLSDPAELASTTAALFESVDPASDALPRLVEAMGNKELLLVMDNCEHVASEAARVAAALLESCPALRVLATSREVLGVPGETVWPAPPLAAEDAAALFEERAKAAAPGFVLDERRGSIVTDICRRLDGLPLAIELAAARVRAFPVEQIAARLDDRFRLLAGGARTTQPRHHALRAVFDWSYDLLFEEERRVFERLSVFVDGCTVEAAEAVCAAADVVPTEVAETVLRLIDKSLVLADTRRESVRFRLLQTLADYGQERLTARGDLPAARRRHASYFVELCRRRQVANGRSQNWAQTVQYEFENVRASLASVIEDGDADSAVAIATGIGWYCWLMGGADEGLRWLRAALDCPGGTTTPDRAIALAFAGYFAALGGSHGAADVFTDGALVTLAGALGNDGAAVDAEYLRTLAFCLFLLAQVQFAKGPSEGGSELSAELGRIYEKVGDGPWVIAARTCIAAHEQLIGGDHARAEELLRCAADALFEAGDTYAGALSLLVSADLVERRGDYVVAGNQVGVSRQVAAELGMPGFEAMCTIALARVATRRGAFDEAEALLAEAERVTRGHGWRPMLALTLNGLALLRDRQGRAEEATTAATEALGLNRTLELPLGAALSFGIMGLLNGGPDRAVPAGG